jgi:hypothetical protein
VFGFAPIASAPLADVTTNYVLSATEITTQAPILGATTLTNVYNFVPTGITAGYPALGTTFCGELEELLSDPIATDSPVVGSSSVLQDHLLDGGGIVSGTPSLATATVTQRHSLSSESVVVSFPILGITVLAQNHSLTAGNITTGTPNLLETSIKEYFPDRYSRTNVALSHPLQSRLIAVAKPSSRSSLVQSNQSRLSSVA